MRDTTVAGAIFGSYQRRPKPHRRTPPVARSARSRRLPPAAVVGDQQDEREHGEHDHREDDEHACLGEARMRAAGQDGGGHGHGVIAPDWRNMPRRPATAAAWSGASWSVALLAAGV